MTLARALGCLAASYLVCLGCAAPQPAGEPEPATIAFVDAGLPAETRDASVDSDARAPNDAACHDGLDGELAKLSCDGERVLVAHNLAFHPSRPAPAEPERGMLAAVAQLMRDHPEILLLRIEVYTANDPPSAEEKQRELEQAQLRANGLFNWLWRHEKLDAERLEGTGYAYDARIASTDASRWPVVLRVVQRAK